MDFVRTLSTKSLTTLKFTSASSSARRTSRRASLMFSSVISPWPRSFLKTDSSFSERLSNIAGYIVSSHGIFQKGITIKYGPENCQELFGLLQFYHKVG